MTASTRPEPSADAADAADPADPAATAPRPAPAGAGAGMSSQALAGRTARVVTASSRAAAGVYADRGGALIVSTLRGWGMEVPEPAVVPDGDAVVTALRAALADEPDLLLTTGGTGLTPTDGTPEATAPLLDRLVPGVAEAIRAHGVRHGIPTASLSRGLAGISGVTFIVNLPGSTGGVRDGLAVLEPLLAHVFSQIRGGDH